MLLIKAKTKIIFDNDWLKKLKFVEHTDEDLVNKCSAIAVKSASGGVFDFYRGGQDFDPFEAPEEYKYTKLYETLPEVKKLVDSFKFKTSRIRIHKQPPGKTIELHTDSNNWHDTPKEKYLLRSTTALSDSPESVYNFEVKGELHSYTLKRGETIIFDPDLVKHGMENRSTKNHRYALVQVFQAFPVSDWFKNFINVENEIIL